MTRRSPLTIVIVATLVAPIAIVGCHNDAKIVSSIRNPSKRDLVPLLEGIAVPVRLIDVFYLMDGGSREYQFIGHEANRFSVFWHRAFHEDSNLPDHDQIYVFLGSRSNSEDSEVFLADGNSAILTELRRLAKSALPGPWPEGFDEIHIDSLRELVRRIFAGQPLE